LNRSKGVIRIVLLVATLVVFAGAYISVYFINTFIKLDAGVCISEGRILDDEEHRRAFLRSMVRLGVDNSNVHNNLIGTQALRTGIIHNSPVFDFFSLITEFSKNERSFEDNFSINVVAPGAVEFDVNKDLHEPFTLVVYRVSPSGSSSFTDSRNVNRTSAPKGYAPSLYEKYQGFGRHYYRIEYTFVRVDCCSERAQGEDRLAYIERKSKAYLGSIKSLERGLAVRTSVAAASNCGDILTESSDNGVGTRSIRWITF
jgi:hypothetical protein